MNLSTIPSPPFLLRTALPLFLVSLILLGGCVEESSSVLTFDVDLESVTFNNHLHASAVLYQDGAVLDTIPAHQTRTYPIGRHGPIRYAWRLIAPYDRYGAKVGVEPYVDLGVQYRLRETYNITNDLPSGSQPKGGTIFTPIIVNTTSLYDVQLLVNYNEDDQVRTNYVIRHGSLITPDSAPYFYWHSTSNVRLESTTNSYYWYFSREDTTASGDPELRLDESLSEYRGTGRTNQLVF